MTADILVYALIKQLHYLIAINRCHGSPLFDLAEEISEVRDRSRWLYIGSHGMVNRFMTDLRRSEIEIRALARGDREAVLVESERWAGLYLESAAKAGRSIETYRIPPKEWAAIGYMEY